MMGVPHLSGLRLVLGLDECGAGFGMPRDGLTLSGRPSTYSSVIGVPTLFPARTTEKSSHEEAAETSFSRTLE